MVKAQLIFSAVTLVMANAFSPMQVPSNSVSRVPSRANDHLTADGRVYSHWNYPVSDTVAFLLV